MPCWAVGVNDLQARRADCAVGPHEGKVPGLKGPHKHRTQQHSRPRDGALGIAVPGVRGAFWFGFLGSSGCLPSAIYGTCVAALVALLARLWLLASHAHFPASAATHPSTQESQREQARAGTVRPVRWYVSWVDILEREVRSLPPCLVTRIVLDPTPWASPSCMPLSDSRPSHTCRSERVRVKDGEALGEAVVMGAWPRGM